MTELQITDLKDSLIPGSFWLLNKNVKGYQNSKNNELATEARSGRYFEIVNNANLTNSKHQQLERIQVILLEDGYRCWFEVKDIFNHIESINRWEPRLLTSIEISRKLPSVIAWVEKASRRPNYYLWGGTIGPNFDCSGLIQTAFSSENIWIPRDAYQQEIFCNPVIFNKNTFEELVAGDLLFFGNSEACTHVALYKGEGSYWHSSGIKNGRNGISVDSLQPINKHDISSYYLSILRGAGRVNSCHDGSLIA